MAGSSAKSIIAASRIAKRFFLIAMTLPFFFRQTFTLLPLPSRFQPSGANGAGRGLWC
jgi:hypothetical protein